MSRLRGRTIGYWREFLAAQYGINPAAEDFWGKAEEAVEGDEELAKQELVKEQKEVVEENLKKMAEEKKGEQMGLKDKVRLSIKNALIRRGWEEWQAEKAAAEQVARMEGRDKKVFEEEEVLTTEKVGTERRVMPRGGEVRGPTGEKAGTKVQGYVPGEGVKLKLRYVEEPLRAKKIIEEFRAREDWGEPSARREPIRAAERGIKGLFARIFGKGKEKAVGAAVVDRAEGLAKKGVKEIAEKGLTAALAATPLAPIAPLVAKAAVWVADKIGINRIRKFLELAIKVGVGIQVALAALTGALVSFLFVKFGGILGGISMGSLVGGIVGGLIPGVGFGWGAVVGGGIGAGIQMAGGMGSVITGGGVVLGNFMGAAMSLGTGIGGIAGGVVAGSMLGAGILTAMVTITTLSAFFNPELNQVGADIEPQLVEVVKTVDKAAMTNEEAKTATVRYAILLGSRYTISETKYSDTITVIKASGPVKTLTRQITGDNVSASDELILSSLGIDLSDSMIVNFINTTGKVTKDGKLIAFGPITGGTTVTIGTAPMIAFSCPLIPNGGIACVSKNGSAQYSCHHCDATYLKGPYASACKNFPGNDWAMDVMGSLSQPVYLPLLNGQTINWTYTRTGTDADGQVFREFKTTGGYLLQLHHMKRDTTLEATLRGKTLASGTVVGNLAAFPSGKSSPHSHIQIQASGTWLPAETVLCK